VPQIPVGADEQREAAIGCAAVVNPFSESVAGETADQQLSGFCADHRIGPNPGIDRLTPCLQALQLPQSHWHACCYEPDRVEISHDIRAQRSLHDWCLHSGDMIQGK
jgi:hypothetical protein